MAKKSDLQRALDLIDLKIAALQDAKAAIESTQQAMARVSRPSRKKKAEAAA